MEIIDLTEEHLPLYFKCLEDWNEEMEDAGHHKETWYEKMKSRGLEVKLALDDNGAVGGMIQYLPIEQSFAEGEELYFIPCIWVHGYKKGRGDFQGKGMGKALLAAAENDIREKGAKGVAAWGMMLPVWMKASWFRKQGFRRVDRNGIAVLLWKPFSDDAVPPKWLKHKKKPELEPGRVTVTALVSGWCVARNIVCERAQRAAVECGEKVVFREIDTSEKENLREWGVPDTVFIGNRSVGDGPPPSYEKIKKRVLRQMKKV